MYNGLLHAHSGWRWVILALLIAAIVQAFLNMQKNTPLTKSNRKIALFAMIATHIQLVFGLWLYFISPKVSFGEGFMKNELFRFYTIEHLTVMLLGIILITIGHSRGKKSGSFKPVFWFYLVGLVVILSRIPWPFQNLGANWF